MSGYSAFWLKNSHTNSNISGFQSGEILYFGETDVA